MPLRSKRRRSTDEFVTPFGENWSGRWDLNPRHLAWKASALPLSYVRIWIRPALVREGGSFAPLMCPGLSAMIRGDLLVGLLRSPISPCLALFPQPDTWTLGEGFQPITDTLRRLSMSRSRCIHETP